MSGPGVTTQAKHTLLSVGDYEVFQLMDNHPNEFLFNIQDSAENRGLFSEQLPNRALTGNSEYPYDLPVSYLFKDNRTVIINAKNGSTAGANDGVLTMIGCHYSDMPVKAIREIIYEGERADIAQRSAKGRFFAYGIELNFGKGNNDELSVAIDIFNELAFELYYLTSSHDTSKPFTVQIEDLTTDRQLFREPTPSANILGVGQRPFVLPVTRIFSAKGTISITAVNGPASGIHTGYLVLSGANLRREDYRAT